MKDIVRQKPAEKVWEDFKDREQLTEVQLDQFKKYEALLSEWNRSYNLTAISGLSETVNRHFSDSIVLRNFLDLSKVSLIADVGSGAGFPGVPLKIIFPHLKIILIEVTKKKQSFLKAVISALSLQDIEVCDIDWRTFLRKTESEVEFFLTRASLDPVELCRMFKPSCFYNNRKLVYWATQDWEPDFRVEKFVRKQYSYKIKRRDRKLVFMWLP